MAHKKITFEDNGQDFLEWKVDEQGLIQESWPFQTELWGKYEIENMAELHVGGLVKIIGPSWQGIIKHRIESIEVIV